jgi:hypothetical protein
MSFQHRIGPNFKEPKITNGTRRGLLHMGRVKQLPCVCCGAYPPSDAHHCKSPGYKGNEHSMQRDDFKTIPLCKNHHQGPEGYHTQKETWHATYGKDWEYLAVVADALAGELNK